MDDGLARIERKVDALDAKLETQIDRVDRRVDGVIARLDVVGVRLDQLTTRVDVLDRKVEALDRKIDVQFKAVRDEVRNLAEGLVALGERMDRRFDEMIRDSQDFRQALYGILGNHEERITALERGDA